MDADTKIEVRVCGRILGMASGWEVVEECHIFFTQVEPCKELEEIMQRDAESTEELTLSVDFNQGILYNTDEEGKTIWEADLIWVCSKIQRVPSQGVEEGINHGS